MKMQHCVTPRDAQKGSEMQHCTCWWQRFWLETTVFGVQIFFVTVKPKLHPRQHRSRCSVSGAESFTQSSSCSTNVALLTHRSTGDIDTSAPTQQQGIETETSVQKKAVTYALQTRRNNRTYAHSRARNIKTLLYNITGDKILKTAIAIMYNNIHRCS